MTLPALCVTIAAVLLGIYAVLRGRPDVALLCVLGIAFQSMDLT